MMQSDDFGRVPLLPPADADESEKWLAPVRRIAVLTESFLPKVDGVSKTAYLTVRYLRETGREFMLFAPDSALDHLDGGEVVHLPSLALPGAQEMRVALPLPWVAQRIAAYQPDLIHIISPAFMPIWGVAAGRELQVPIVSTYQTDYPGFAAHYKLGHLRWLAYRWPRYLHNGCHLTLVPSASVREHFKEHAYRRLRVWEHGVELERFHPNKRSSAMRERLLAGRDPDSLLCVYVGRLAPEKSVEVLRELAATEGIALTLIGDGDYRPHLEKVFAGTGTHFTGYLYKSELAAAFASADVFCLASAHETFGLVVLEAMASGLPAIVTDLGGAKDRVRDGETGFIVPQDPAAFAEVARRLRDDPHLRCQMGEAARAYAEERPWWRIMRQLEHHYNEAIRLNARFARRYGRTNRYRPFVWRRSWRSQA